MLEFRRDGQRVEGKRGGKAGARKDEKDEKGKINARHMSTSHVDRLRLRLGKCRP
jgi:hypothetical protein